MLTVNYQNFCLHCEHDFYYLDFYLKKWKRRKRELKNDDVVTYNLKIRNRVYEKKEKKIKSNGIFLFI